MKDLFKAVQAHSEFDKETFSDIANYGADGGFGSFVYYSDTIKFFDNNKELVLEAVKDLASDMDEDPLAMIAGFNCLKSLELDSFQVAQAIYEDGSEDETSIKNALAWFALEEVARAVQDGQFDSEFEDTED